MRESEFIDEVLDLIPLILTFSRREKGLADLSKSFQARASSHVGCMDLLDLRILDTIILPENDVLPLLQL